MSKLPRSKELSIIGWREKLTLPQLGIEAIKAKIDTGARSSALHAFDVHTFTRNDKEIVKFKVHPYQKDTHTTITAEAELLEYRKVTNSGGHSQLRPVIETMVKLGAYEWKIELTLTNRDVMGFRMLLGRQAVKKRFLIDSSKSFLQCMSVNS
jgi:hypothetical protein